MLLLTAIEPQAAPCEWLWLECQRGVTGRGDHPKHRWLCVHPAAPWRPVTPRECEMCTFWEPRHTRQAVAAEI